MINDINGQQVGHNHTIPNGLPEGAIPPHLYQQPMVDAGRQCHIYTYESPWRCYAMGYSWRQDFPYRFALGSFIEDKTNKVLKECEE